MTELHYDIVGSFLRPQTIKEAKEKFAAGEINQDELTDIENQEIEKLVDKEIDAGLKVVTDGELRRRYWHLDTFWGFDGIEHTQASIGYVFHDETTKPDSANVVGKIKFNENHPDLQAFKFLNKIATEKGVPARQSIPAPAQLYEELYRDPEHAKQTKKIYPNDNELINDIAHAYHDLIIALYNAGCRDVKLDDCTWGLLVDTELCKKIGYNPQELAPKFLKVNNEAIKDLPKDLRVSTHICRGNFHSTWACQGGYAAVAPYVFAKENVDAFYLEFDNERSGSFDPIKEIPNDKLVVLGLVTSKKSELEDSQKLVERINEAAKFHPLENLALSTQCGFASTEEGNTLTEDDQWKKIKLVIDTAKQVWG